MLSKSTDDNHYILPLYKSVEKKLCTINIDLSYSLYIGGCWLKQNQYKLSIAV